MDAGEPPQIVFEGRRQCVDAPGAEALLDRSLAAARAPSAGWVLFVRLERVGANALRADGDVIDETGASVAHRVLSGSPANCAGLARAMSVWASLVLDTELARPIASKRTTALAPLAGGSAAPADRAAGTSIPARPPADIDGPLGEHKDTHAPLIDKQGQPYDSVPSAKEPRALEIGLGTFLMTNTGGKALVGVTPHAVVPTGHGFLLRPALSFGESLPGPSSDTQWLSARLDVCSRLHGLYASGGGLQLDLCGGPDVGLMVESAGSMRTTAPYLSLGPSVDLRGDLLQDISVVLRAVAGFDLVPVGASGRMELALAWRMP